MSGGLAAESGLAVVEDGGMCAVADGRRSAAYMAVEIAVNGGGDARILSITPGPRAGGLEVRDIQVYTGPGIPEGPTDGMIEPEDPAAWAPAAGALIPDGDRGSLRFTVSDDGGERGRMDGFTLTYDQDGQQHTIDTAVTFEVATTSC